jgi:hypothetical protein
MINTSIRLNIFSELEDNLETSIFLSRAPNHQRLLGVTPLRRLRDVALTYWFYNQNDRGILS